MVFSDINTTYIALYSYFLLSILKKTIKGKSNDYLSNYT